MVRRGQCNCSSEYVSVGVRGEGTVEVVGCRWEWPTRYYAR